MPSGAKISDEVSISACRVPNAPRRLMPYRLGTVRKLLIFMARETGLEPATSGVTGRRSNQLSYSPATRRRMGRAGGLPDRIGR